MALPAAFDEPARAIDVTLVDPADEELKTADAGWTVLDPTSFSSEKGAVLEKLADRSVLASGPAPTPDSYHIAARTDLTAITGIRLEVLPDPGLPGLGEELPHALRQSERRQVAGRDDEGTVGPFRGLPGQDGQGARSEDQAAAELDGEGHRAHRGHLLLSHGRCEAVLRPISRQVVHRMVAVFQT